MKNKVGGAGWVKLYRKLRDDPMWLEEPFTRGQAWVDLILLAKTVDSEMVRRGVTFSVPRGAVTVGEEALALRWKWSRGKLRRFLALLFKMGQAERKYSEILDKSDGTEERPEESSKMVQKKTSVTCLIYIINFDEYQSSGTEKTVQTGTEVRPEESSLLLCSKKYIRPNGHGHDHLKPFFDHLWGLNPRKIKKERARKILAKINPSPDLQKIILASYTAQITAHAWATRNKEYCPYLSTWLNDKQWMDDVPTAIQDQTEKPYWSEK